MRSFIIFVLVLFSIGILGGCVDSGQKSNDNELTEKKPPNMSILINGNMYDAELGPYCWSYPSEVKDERISKCVDVMLHGKDEQPIKAGLGEVVELIIDYISEPDKLELVLNGNENEMGTKIEMTDNQFLFPLEKGIYVYDYDVKWLDPEDALVAVGSVTYGFILEVE